MHLLCNKKELQELEFICNILGVGAPMGSATSSDTVIKGVQPACIT